MEVTQLQVGDRTNDVKVIVSTLAEAEHLSDFLRTCVESRRSVNVSTATHSPGASSHPERSFQILYGIPLPPSQTERLAHLGTKLGIKSISVLVDNTFQLQAARAFKDMAGFSLQVFVKIDTGYHRAGVVTGTEKFNRLINEIFDEESRGTVELMGFYSHAGHSYGKDSALGAMELLVVELEGLEKAAKVASVARDHSSANRKFVLSVGATPTATSIENMLAHSVQAEPSVTAEIAKLKTVIERINAMHVVEIHAGVYPFLDMQQLATQASPSALATNSKRNNSGLSTADIAMTIMVEVASLYENRDVPEALIAAGSLALGRDPCKSYNGWGIVSDWGMVTEQIEGRSGWQVGRVSQEHGILTRDSQHKGLELAELKIGQKLRLWPNHACVAGAGFGWYLVVDSSLPEDRRDQVVDVWVRCRGW